MSKGLFGRKEKPLATWEPETVEEELLLDIVYHQRRQTKYLKDINLVVQVFGILLILSVLAGCVAALFGGTVFSSLF